MGRSPRTTTSPTKAKAANANKRSTAWRAVQNFNKITPTLTGFARSLTGNPKVIVKAGKGTMTDGQIVYLRPPLSMADPERHDRTLCDERDENMQLLCKACNQSEVVWRLLHHELSHILGNSMAAPDPDVLDEFMKLVYEWHPASACSHGTDMERKARRENDYLPVFHAFSPWVWLLSQCLEDARIDSMMLTIKPGLRKQFYASHYDTFTRGVENDEGEYALWRDYPINNQILIGLMLIGSGYEIEEGWLRPEVIDILADPTLTEIAQEAPLWTSVHDSTLGTIRAYRRLAELGFCKEEKCQDMPSLGNPGDSPSEGKEDDDTDPGDTGGSEATGDSSQDAGDPSVDDADASPSGGDGSSDGSPDATGDGTEGGTASSGAFGDDFENDARGDGEDKEGGNTDGKSQEESLPDDDGDDDTSGGAARPEDQASDGDDGLHPDESGSEDDAEAERSTSNGDSPEADEDAGEAGSEGDTESSAEDIVADTDGDESSQGGTGDIGGSPVDSTEGSVEDDPDTETEGSDATQLEGTGTEDGPQDDASGGEPGEEDDEGGDASSVGEDIWDDDNSESNMIPVALDFEPEELGTAEQAVEDFKLMNPHEDTEAQRVQRGEVGDQSDETDDGGLPPLDARVVMTDDRALQEAITQAMYFDKSSQGVGGVAEYTYPATLFQWCDGPNKHNPSEYMPSEEVIGGALLKARIVFAANKRASHTTNLKSGRINTRVLGRRAPVGDDRLFRKKEVPSKRDYIIGITIDCSGSTGGRNRLNRIKRAVFAKAELLHRLGVPFYITAHTGGKDSYWASDYTYGQTDDSLENLMILWVKKIDEPWNNGTRERLANLQPLANNYDGHTLEFHRKLLEARQETDRVLIYYTDGDMPAANYDEELDVLRTELEKMDRLGIKKLAVGINTRSPEEYGFDTVQVDSDADLLLVVEQLKSYLIR